MQRKCILVLQAAALFVLAACGGGGSSSFGPSGGSIAYTAGVFPASSTFANQCETPRTGMCPWGAACPDTKGSALAEKHFLRSWTNELYLWYSEVPDTNPASATGTVEDYFDTLKTAAVLPSGQLKDRFHFTYDTADYYALSTAGVTQGYGIDWVVIEALPPRLVAVEMVQPGGAAAGVGITRGAELDSVDGVDVVNTYTQAGVDAINSALFTPASGSTHTFVFRDRGTGAARTVTLTAAAVTENPVPTVTVNTVGSSKVGYILFNDHIATAELALQNAIQQLAAAQVNDLVLDMRYNGGGYLDIAAELAYMIAGPATNGLTFEKLQFNSKYPTTNPVTQVAITPTPFYSTAQGFSVATGTALPTLNLPRVYVLTSGGTCSASEAVINGLRGAGITVYQFGADTCGKPYGFYVKDNCGTSYFSIEFKGVNNQGFGDYPEGFSATRSDALPGTSLPGCAASDDITHELGDPLEGQLAVALSYYGTGHCPVVSSKPSLPRGVAAVGQVPNGLALRVPQNPVRDNRILR
ncbi:MAG: S41 family peptidase [Pseudomonadota bacterium]